MDNGYFILTDGSKHEIPNTDYYLNFNVLRDLAPGISKEHIAEICIPPSVTTIPAQAFSSCINLRKVGFVDQSYYALTYIELDAFRDCRALTSFDFSGVFFVGPYAFQCSGLTQVHIHDGTAVGSNAFFGCPDLIDVTYDAPYIPEYCFSCCKKLKSLEGHAKFVDNYAFEDCESLKFVDLFDVGRAYADSKDSNPELWKFMD